LQGGLAGTDDRRACMLVNAMGLTDLDVLQPGGGQDPSELAFGQRTRDAPWSSGSFQIDSHLYINTD
jgi:hypothetical protein